MSEKKLDKNKIICGGIFFLYAVVTLVGALNHELWFDEAQAWTIARDNDIAGIFRQLGYEGHPPLWYLILYVFSHLGFKCTVIPVISWFVTAAAGAVIMFKAPFNTFIKSAVLLSGGFLYFNSVMSRVYCLINLAVVLIAWLYPKRREHPVLFGLLVALLANTHICVSGFIGILGLFMIADLFKGFKTNSPKQNAMEIIGLAIAGAGVLTLVLPLIGSLRLNNMTSDTNYTAGLILSKASDCLTDIALSLFDYTPKTLFLFIAANILAAMFIIELILMRHKTRPLLIMIFFGIFFIITSEIVWTTIPNRAHIFLLMFFITAWIAEYEPENGSGKLWTKFVLKTDTAAINKLLGFVRTADQRFMRSYAAVLAAMLIAAAPMGVYYLCADTVKPFSPSKQTAEYIRENFPEGSVFITSEETAPILSAYAPEYRFYSIGYSEFYTYYGHKNGGETDYSKIYGDLKNCENLYYMNMAVDIDFIESNRDIIYTVRDGLPYGTNIMYIEISEFDLEREIKSHIGGQL